MRILITGGAGFIGSTVAHRLLQDGHAVRVLDNLETGLRANVPARAELLVGDIRDPEAVAEAMQGCSLVVHLAAMVSVPLSVADPALCLAINAEGTRQVLAAAHRAGVRRVVMASTAAVYGNLPTLPKHEAMPPDHQSPYAYSKWLNEVDAAYYSRFMGLETVCLRFFNVYGPRQRPDSPYSGVISIAADKLLAGQPFTIFGTGEQSRDFVFSEDVAGAVAAALAAPAVGHAVINVGTGRSVSLLDLVETMGRAARVTPDLRFAPPRDGDVLHSRADVSRLRMLLGYEARTPLQTGLEATLAWMKDAARANA